MATTRQQLGQSPLAMAAEAKALGGEQEEKLLLCSECNRNYEREASVVKVEADDEGPRFGLPAWLVLENKPPVDHRMQHKVLNLRGTERSIRTFHCSSWV
jgi:hypothetical protein